MSLNRKNVLDIIPLTPTQLGILFECLNQTSLPIYVEQLCFDLKRIANKEVIEEAFQYLVENNVALRCSFRWKNISSPVAIYQRKVPFACTFHDLTKEKKERKIENCKSIAQNDYEKHFNLEEIPFRVSLCQLSSDEYRVVISNHHILYDGWSNIILLNQLFGYIYKGIQEENADREKLRGIKKYIEGINHLQSEESKAFWIEHLGVVDKPTGLPYRRSKPTIEKLFKKVSLPYSKFKVQDFSSSNKLTIGHLMHGVWGLLLQIYNNSDRAIFGSVTSGRDIDVVNLNNTVGLFINSLPLCVKSNSEQLIIDYLQNLSESFIKRSSFELVQLSEIKKWLNLPEEGELFNSILVVENYPLGSLLKNYRDFIDLDSIEAISNNHYDLTIEISFFDELNIDFVYNASVFEESSIQLIADQFKIVLDYFIEFPEHQIKNINIAKGQEEIGSKYNINDTTVEILGNETIIDLFRRTVKKNPEKIAIISGGDKYSYEKFFNKSLSVANALKTKGVQANTIVAIYLDRSLDFLIGVYGIMMSGAAYMPISPQFPEKRVEYIIADSSCKHVLTVKKYKDKVPSNVTETIFIEDCEELNEQNEIRVEPTHLAYVIYTSGTTGRPKGVMIDHGALLNRLLWMQKNYPIGPDSNILHKTTPVFDVSVWELFWWSLNAGLVTILPEGDESKPNQIVESIYTNQATIIHFVPSMLTAFLNSITDYSIQKLKSLGHVFCSGEALTKKNVSKFNELFENTNTQLVNLYGPTEATIDVSYYNCDANVKVENIPIGRPIDNTKLFVINKLGSRQPSEVPGELAISGMGLARGYINKVELTHQKFKKDNALGVERIYKTGDLAQLNKAGQIEYLGRLDYQVKLRGFRIELPEIERVLENYSPISKVAVLHKTDANDQGFLYAFYTANNEQDKSELIAHLKDNLPSYMIPSKFHYLESFPLNINGKLDRSSLKKISIGLNKKSSKIKIKLSDTETRLLGICKDVLGFSEIDIEDGFIGSGGDSIKAIELQSRFSKEGFKINIPEIMKASSLRQLFATIENIITSEYNSKEVIGEVPLTPIEKQFFNSNFTNPNNFTQGITLTFSKRLNKEHLHQALNLLQGLHDNLRAIYKNLETEVIKTIRTDNLTVNFQSFENHENTDIFLQESKDKLRESIDLESGKMMVFALVTNQEKDQLIIIAHHLLVDGVSWRVLVSDFIDIYENIALGKTGKDQHKSSSVKEWAESLLEFAKESRLLKTIEHWESIQSKNITNNVFPVKSKWSDFKRISIKLTRGDTQNLLYKVNKAYNTTLAEVLITAIVKAYIEITEQSELIIALEGHGRENIKDAVDLNRTVGWFTNIYPVLFGLKNANNIGENLVEVKETIRKVPFNGLSYGVLKYLTPNVDLNINAPVLFNYLGDIQDDAVQRKGIECEFHNDRGTMDRKNEIMYKLLVSAMINQDCLEVYFDYDNKYYQGFPISNLVDSFRAKLNEIITHCLGQKTGIRTPSDFSDKNLSMEELNIINQLFEKP
ncbi:amino acid adenylation domain-containing protein [Dokdonia sp.]|uniref:amino acid adenylation domain-containing protein n=1 Tax=Dokdonia sp. TaxID=2024995 RepID=UPI003263B505